MMLYGKECEVGVKEQIMVERCNFADDTTQYEQVLMNWITNEFIRFQGEDVGEERSLVNTWKKLGLEKMLLELGPERILEREEGFVDLNAGGPALKIFRAVCAEIGARENFSKYVQGLLGSGELTGRNLGQMMSQKVDSEVRKGRGWSNYHSWKGRVRGIHLGLYQKAAGMIALVRSALLFGMTSRSCTVAEIIECQQVENRVLMRLMGTNIF